METTFDHWQYLSYNLRSSQWQQMNHCDYISVSMTDLTANVRRTEISGLILGLRSASERRRYFVTAYLIVGVQA